MTVRFEFTVWISKLWLVDINLKIMTVGLKKKKKTIRLLDTNQTAIIGATIPTVRSSILVVRWLKTSIWRWQYGGRQDQSGGIRWSHYSDGLVTDSSSTVVGDIDLVAAVRWATRPIWRCSSEPLFRQFGHWTSITSFSIGRATDVGCLIYKFKLKKYDHYGK